MYNGFELQTLLGCSIALCALGILQQSFELLRLRVEFQVGGLMDPTAESVARSNLSTLSTPQATTVVLLLRGGLAILCVFTAWGDLPPAWAVAALFAVQLYYIRRFDLVLTNADHMNLVCLGAAVVGSIGRTSPNVLAAALLFLALQACIAYSATGWDKLIARNWRNGSRLVQIFQDSAHRFPMLGDFIAARPSRAAILTWAVIVFEVSFPIAVVCPTALFWAYLAGSFLFHLAIAVTMALPIFLWAFAATYPGLYLAHVLWSQSEPLFN